MALYAFLPWKWTSHICREHSFHQKVFFNLEGKMEMEQGNSYRKEIYTSSLFVGKRIRDTKVDSGMDRKQGSQIPSFLCLSLLPINMRISFKVEYMVWMVCITKSTIYVWGKVYISYSGIFASLTCSTLTRSCALHRYTFISFLFIRMIKG